MSDRVGWGVLGAARIAVNKVIPAMQAGAYSRVVAIASRSLENAEAAARALGIRRAYGSYHALVEDPDVEAVYIPLPNHLHLPWSLRAAERGKHVLCEKPIGLNAAEAEALLAARDRTGVAIGEAFMVRVHPQWAAAVELVRAGRIGEARSLDGHFSFFLDDEHNVRHVAAYGGGALLDVGCYLVNVARLVFGGEPSRAFAAMERDPRTGVDVRTSLVLEFGDRVATGTCGMRSARHQRVEVFGTRGRLEVEVPFGVPPDRQTHVTVDGGSDAIDPWRERIAFGPLNQYTLQGDLFSRAIREGGPVPCPLEDSVANMRVLDALARSALTGKWEQVSKREVRSEKREC